MVAKKAQDAEKITGEEYKGGMMHVILEIPDAAYHLDIVAKTINDDENTQIVTTRMGLADIRQARQDFLDNVPAGDEYNAVWGITQKGLESLNGKQ